MFTYVINTSENKTLDSDKLFRLACYNSICWKNCRLDTIDKCAEDILDKSTSVFTDGIRLAVLVDFYGFKKIRRPYGVDDYSKEDGVDLSIYLPFIEAYVADHLFSYLSKYNVYVNECAIYYIQNGKFERYTVLDNSIDQISYILTGNKDKQGESITVEEAYLEIGKYDNSEIEINEGEKLPPETLIEKLIFFGYRQKTGGSLNHGEFSVNKNIIELVPGDRSYSKVEIVFSGEYVDDITCYNGNSKDKDVISFDIRKVIDESEDDDNNDLSTYSAFTLYCTDNVSLKFTLDDYPYTDKKSLTMRNFISKFSERMGAFSKVRKYHFDAVHSFSPAGAAFDALTLSLYLIKTYECGETVPAEGYLEVEKIAPDVMREYLELSLNNVAAARIVATENNSDYYQLDNIMKSKEKESVTTKEEDFDNIKVKTRGELMDNPISPEKQYARIDKISDPDPEAQKEIRHSNFKEIFKTYLHERDMIVQEDSDSKYYEPTESGEHFPSQAECNYIIKLQEERISSILKDALDAEFIEMDFAEDREQAQETYKEYRKLKRSLKIHLIGDIVTLLLALVAFLVPYGYLQSGTFNALWLLGAGLTFCVLFLISAGIFVGSLLIKLRKVKRQLFDIYVDCEAKYNYSMDKIKKRYEEDLPKIEKIRYGIRQIRYYYNLNVIKNNNIRTHREQLEDLQDNLSAILNNLGVVPKINIDTTNIAALFDIEQPIMSARNRIYRVFSVEAIENLFANSKRGE